MSATCPNCGEPVPSGVVGTISVDLDSMPEVIHGLCRTAAEMLREEAEAASHPEIARAIERVAAQVEAGVRG